MAFLKKPRDLPKLKLCGNDLPWVETVKHLGNTVSNKIDGFQTDMQIKNAQFIDKCNTICQEFWFAHPYTKARIGNIYNSLLTGSQLWKIRSRGCEKIISSYNRSINFMYNLPWETHRCLLEPLSGLAHVSKFLLSRYISFICKLRNSKKTSIRELFETVKSDVRITTGTNLRTAMFMLEKNTIGELLESNLHYEYQKMATEDNWKVELLKELIEVREDSLSLEQFEIAEIDEIIT